jgi:hypothetical protein
MCLSNSNLRRYTEARENDFFLGMDFAWLDVDEA